MGLVKIVLILMLSIQFTHGQDFVNLYKKYLPEKIIHIKSYRNNINNSLELYANLNPDLIYYYLTNLHLKLEKKITNPDSNFTNILAKKFRYSRYQKNKWGQQQIEQLNSNAQFAVVANRLSAVYFSEYFLGENEIEEDNIEIKEKVSIDLNKMNFFKYMYLVSDSTLTYESENNYAELIQDNLDEIITKLDESYKNANILEDNEKEKSVSLAFKYPYILKSNYLNTPGLTTNFYMYELLLAFYGKEIKTKNSISLYLSRRDVPVNFGDSFLITDKYGNDYKRNYKLKLINSTIFEIGLKLKTKDKFKGLSFINFRIGYSLDQQMTSNLDEEIALHFINSWSGYWESEDYIINNFGKYKAYVINSILSTPVYYLNENWYFEAGVCYIYQYMQFEYDYYEKIYYRQIYQGIEETIENLLEQKYKKEKHYFYPIFIINYSLFRYFNAAFEYVIPNRPRVTLSIQYPF